MTKQLVATSIVHRVLLLGVRDTDGVAELDLPCRVWRCVVAFLLFPHSGGGEGAGALLWLRLCTLPEEGGDVDPVYTITPMRLRSEVSLVTKSGHSTVLKL